MEYVTYKELYLAYEDCKKGKRSSYYCAEFELHAPMELYKLYVELNKGTYKPSSSIAFVVHYPKDREVFAANFRDRIVHHLLIRRINKYLEERIFIESNFACRVGKGTFYGIKYLQETIERVSENYTKKVDILIFDYKNFFMSIDKDIMNEVVSEFLDEFLLTNVEFYQKLFEVVILDKPQTHCIIKQDESNWDPLPKHKSLRFVIGNLGMPIGNLTSQILASLYMTIVDRYCVKKYGKDYGRYVDDGFVVVLHTETSIQELKDFVVELDQFSYETRRIHIHPNKVHIKSEVDSIMFLGGMIKDGRKTPIRRTLNKFKSVLKYYSEEYSCSIPTQSELELPLQRLNSYLGYMRQFDTYRIRKSIVLNPKYELVFNKFKIDNYGKVNLRTMRIAHSFWSLPCDNSRLDIPSSLQWRVNIYCAMISVLYAKSFGYQVDFYGDERAIRKFRMIPYDRFIEIKIPEGNPSFMWAQGKFYAMKQMSLGDVHIDIDVFMKSKEIYDILESKYDCIVQGLEDQFQTNADTYGNARQYLSSVNFGDGCNTDVDLAYNVGVIGFKSQKLKDIYLKHYFESLEKISHLNPPGKNIVPDLIIEQQHLYQLSNLGGFNVVPLLGASTLNIGEKNETLYEDAERLKYQHVLSIFKYMQFDKLHDELERLDSRRCKVLDTILR